MTRRKRTNRLCIALEVMKIDKNYYEEINQIRKIQTENDITFNDARLIYNERKKIDVIEDLIFN
jgi:uncharacterized membrane-anchored protein YitT (DUF2179 family)